ncbi:(2Fe-2S)-binding protein [Nitrospira sp. Kam-Ns4a]
MYVCLCKGLTEADVRQAGRAGHVDSTALVKKLGLDDDECCGRCARNIHELVAIASGRAACGADRTRCRL